MKLMPRPSPQFLIAAVASVLAMSAFALSAPVATAGSRGAPGLLPAEASLALPGLSALLAD
ncbi:MAG: hypothetical protein ACTHKM_11000 [Tsuneonella sp.]